MSEQRFTLPRMVPRERQIQRMARFLDALSLDQAWEVIVRPVKRKRTCQQNRALWGVAYEALRQATGNDPEDLHEYFLGERFGWEIREVMGKKKKVPRRRSSKMSTTEFADFYAFVQQRSAEMGYYVPDPNEHSEAA